MNPMNVSELARFAAVSADAVRYYARTGLLTPKRNARNGYREFSVSDARRLRFIKLDQNLGFTLGEIATIMRMASQRKSPCPLARDIIKRRVQDAESELEQLILLRERMKKAMAKWKRMRDGVPDGDEICRLIEATDVLDGAHPRAIGWHRRAGRGRVPGGGLG